MLLEYAPEMSRIKGHCGGTLFMLVKATMRDDLVNTFDRISTVSLV